LVAIDAQVEPVAAVLEGRARALDAQQQRHQYFIQHLQHIFLCKKNKKIP